MRATILVLLLLATMLATTCGQKGQLVLPPNEPAKPQTFAEAKELR